LVELLNRFHDDWVNNKIDKEKVFIVRFDSMMYHFDTLMDDILNFIDIEKDSILEKEIQDTAESQKAFKSGHKYDLSKFGLTEDQIKKDCKNIYKTFID